MLVIVRVQLLAAAIALLNNLVSDEDVRATALAQLSAQKGDFQVCFCCSVYRAVSQLQFGYSQSTAAIQPPRRLAVAVKPAQTNGQILSRGMMSSCLQGTKERLLQCISLAGLPDRSQRAARFVLTRLDRKPKDAAKSSLQCCAPLPPRLQPSFYDIWAGAADARRP